MRHTSEFTLPYDAADTNHWRGARHREEVRIWLRERELIFVQSPPTAPDNQARGTGPKLPNLPSPKAGTR